MAPDTGTIGEKQYFILTCTEAFLQYKHGFGMDSTKQEVDLAHEFLEDLHVLNI